MKDGLCSIVNGSKTAPEEGTDGYSKFVSRRDRTLAIIVDLSLFYIVGDPTEPVTVWEKLSTQFQRKTWANKLALHWHLHLMQLKAEQSIKDHVKVMTEIFNELAEVIFVMKIELYIY